MLYVTYDETGALTGSYMQDLLPEHEDKHIEVGDDVRLNWCMYRANEARDGLELLPPAPPNLDAIKAVAIAKTYADVDAVVRDAIGNRAEEYKDAEADARDYAASGYQGDAPASVACYATYNPTGEVQSGQWAADEIIARADAFSDAKLSMREIRFARQAEMRTAATAAELAAASQGWYQFIGALRGQLGL